MKLSFANAAAQISIKTPIRAPGRSAPLRLPHIPKASLDDTIGWPSGLEAAITDGVRLSVPSWAAKDPVVQEVVLFGGLGEYLRCQRANWYARSDILNLAPALEPLRRSFAAQPAPEAPAYAQAPFHVWHGHANWPAAANSEALMSMFAFMALGPEDQRVVGGEMRRSRVLVMSRVVDAAVGALGVPAEEVSLAVDLGCGTALPTRLVAAALPRARVLGVDASAHMLAWAQLRAAGGGALQPGELLPEEAAAAGRVELQRALAEDTSLPTGCADIVLLAFVAHELPLTARRAVFAEAARVLRPGGVFAVVDHSQEGSLGGRVFQLAQRPGWGWLGDAFHALLNVGAPEPWIRQYYAFPVKQTFAEVGLAAAGEMSVTRWQDAMLARKPL